MDHSSPRAIEVVALLDRPWYEENYAIHERKKSQAI